VHFTKIYYHPQFQNHTFDDATVAPTSQVRASTVGPNAGCALCQPFVRDIIIIIIIIVIIKLLRNKLGTFPPLKLVMFQDLALQQGANSICRSLEVFSEYVPSPLRIHVPLLNLTELRH
jgi:hypothetical protein